MTMLKTTLFTLLLVSTSYIPSAKAQTPSAYCNPAKSKPCGKGCIGLTKNCRKSWTTAVSGIRPTASGKIYDKPKFVSKPPKGN